MASFTDGSSGFDSRDCVNLIIDKPGDTTMRPIPPHLLKIVLAERERIAKLREKMRKQQPGDTASDSSAEKET
jgi:hypothetical protein